MHNPLEKNLLFNSETWKGIRIPYSYTKGKETSLSQTPLTRCHKLYSLTFLYAGNNVIIVDFASLCILKLPHMLRAWAILRVTLQRCVCACVCVCVRVCVRAWVCVREKEREKEWNRDSSEDPPTPASPIKMNSPARLRADEIDEKWGWVSFMQVQSNVQRGSDMGCVRAREAWP